MASLDRELGEDPYRLLASARARVGQTLRGKWTLDRLLGVGAMATVYAATHRNKKRGAVKLLHPELSAQPSIRERFLREGYVANSVEHAGAVEVFDDDVTEAGEAYLVMELLEGETLEARLIRKGKKLAPLEVLALMDQLLDTLVAAHAKEILHRDIKPENLFLTRNRALKVLDFGIARIRDLDAGATATLAGKTMGTPAFMAPEQARGRWEQVDGRTDLWALGATMFTLLTGQYVHGEGTVNEVLSRAITKPVLPIAGFEPSLHPAIASFVDRALSYEKSRRFPEAAVMQRELRRIYYAVEDATRPGAQHCQQLSLVDQPSTSEGDARPNTGSPPTPERADATAQLLHRPSNVLGIAAGAMVLMVLLAWMAAAGRAQQAELPPPSPAVGDGRAPVSTSAPPAMAACEAESQDPPVVDIDSLPALRSPSARLPSTSASAASAAIPPWLTAAIDGPTKPPRPSRPAARKTADRD